MAQYVVTASWDVEADSAEAAYKTFETHIATAKPAALNVYDDHDNDWELRPDGTVVEIGDCGCSLCVNRRNEAS